MEQGILLAASAFCAAAAALALIPRLHSRMALTILWSLATASVLADLALMAAYLSCGRFDFSYVYQHTNASLPLLYRISALWSGQEGSFLLWSAVLSVMGYPVLNNKGRSPRRVFGIYALICLCILIMCVVSGPFAKQPELPADGAGLPAALQDPWMTVHPPLVFIAYAAMGVLASLGIAGGTPPETLQRWMRISWVFLGLGIFTGSIWAYRALGWGGYWSWDPIENAALVPWLMLCGFLHRKGAARAARCALPFAAACCGTLLTRSGILKYRSAHAYAGGDGAVTAVIIALILGLTCWMVISRIRRGPKSKTDRAEKLSPATAIYLYAALVALGTMAPLITGAETPTVYYTIASIAFALAYNVTLALRDIEALKHRNLLMMGIGTAFTAGIFLAAGNGNLGWLMLLWVCVMPLSLWIAAGFKTQRWEYYLRHIGMVLLIAGVIASAGLGREGVAIVSVGAPSVDIAGARVWVADMAARNVLIVSSLTRDIIIQCAEISMTADGLIAVPYIVKPMVLLFWLGGFSAVLSPCVIPMIKKTVAFVRRLGKRKQGRRQPEHLSLPES